MKRRLILLLIHPFVTVVRSFVKNIGVVFNAPVREATRTPAAASAPKTIKPGENPPGSLVYEAQMGMALFFSSRTELSSFSWEAWRAMKNFSATCGNRA